MLNYTAVVYVNKITRGVGDSENTPDKMIKTMLT